jgi:hypothetical protein
MRASRALKIAGFLLLAAAGGSSVEAQEPPPAGDPMLRVFLDCPMCDFDFIRTEINWVSWMRDRADAQLHVLVTTRGTSGGGQEYLFDFIGLREQAGKADTLRYVAGRDNTSDATRRGLVQTLKVGLMRYAAGTPAAARLNIALPGLPPGARAAPAVAVADPWNFWTFSVGGSTNMDGESTRESYSFSGNTRASRTTEAWKIDFRVNGRYSEQSFQIPTSPTDFRTVRSINRNYGANSLIARSVTEHLSIGGRASVTTSTFGNTRLALNIAPAIEYNYFPYSESTRRSWIFQYAAGAINQAYREETIFLQTEETRLNHSLNIGYATRQPWGDVNVAVNGSQYLHNTDLYNLVFMGGGSVNLFRGLRLNAFGNYSLVRDQISLPRRSATEEEVLLRQRQLATNYRYFMNVGLSYRFGSAIQNVVNPRFGGGGGESMMIFF